MNTFILLAAAGIGNPPDALLDCPAPIASRGDIKGGPPLLHTFELRNRSAGTLTITKVEAGCGCLRQSLSSGVLAAGETAKLTLEVNTLTQPDGPNRWRIVVAYEIALTGMRRETGVLPLEINCKLSRDVAVSPPQIGFSTEGAARQDLRVCDTRSRPLTVLKATTTSPHLTASVGARVGGKGQSIAVELAADAPVGHRDEAVVLVTDDPEYPEFRIPVRVLKRSPKGVRAFPDSLSVRLASSQDDLSSLVQLRAADGKTVEIAAAESDHPGVVLKHSSGSGAIAVVRVTISESAAGLSGSCTVRVKFARPSGEEIVIPVSWTRAMK